MFGQEAQPLHSDRVGEHLSARSGFDDRLIDGGQQRLDVFEGEIAIDGADGAAGTPILVLEPGPHGLVERLAVHAIQRPAQHPAAIEEGEGQIPLLHAARVVLRVHLSQQFEQLGNRLHGGSTDSCERLGRLDAQPEVLFGQ